MIAMPTYLKLRDGVSPEGLPEKITQHCRDNNVSENFDITLQPLSKVHLYSSDMIFDLVQNKGDIKNVYIFTAVAFLILLVAIINYMNLSTARSTQRAREVGLRKVVGSLRGQLILKFLGESLLLTFIAIILALPIAILALPWLNQVLGIQLSFNLAAGIFIPVFLLFMLFMVGILAGLYPAFVLSNFKPVTVLKGNYGKSKSGNFLRKSLVVFQFALSIALIALTIVVQKQLHFIHHKNLGYDREQVMIFDMNDNRMVGSIQTLRDELAKNSVFSSVATSSNIPGRTFGRTRVRPEGASDEDIWIWSTFAISPETIPTLGMKMAMGRNFDRNMSSDSSGVCIINEEAVRQLKWDDPLNKRIYGGSQDSVGLQVIGVVKDFHFIGMHQPIEPVLIQPLNTFPGNLIAARVQPGMIKDAISYADEKWQQVYPGHPFSFVFMDDEFNALYQQDMNTGRIINIFSLLAIFIACLGLFSLASHATALRIKEIGVRKVLGASTQGIIRLLIFDFIRWVLLANLFAWPLAWFSAHKWLESFAYRTPLDMLPFLIASIIAVLIAIFTVLSQSWRAAVTNPAEALRYE